MDNLKHFTYSYAAYDLTVHTLNPKIYLSNVNFHLL